MDLKNQVIIVIRVGKSNFSELFEFADAIFTTHYFFLNRCYCESHNNESSWAVGCIKVSVEFSVNLLDECSSNENYDWSSDVDEEAGMSQHSEESGFEEKLDHLLKPTVPVTVAVYSDDSDSSVNNHTQVICMEKIKLNEWLLYI